MIAVTHFQADGEDLPARAEAALVALAARPGYRRGSLGRSTDDPGAWLLLTEWDDIGSYRRALGNYDVKLHATPLLADALDVPGGFEALLEVGPGGEAARYDSDRNPLA